MNLHWELDPVLIGTLLSLGVAYGIMVGPLRSRLESGAAFPSRQAAFFYAGLLVAFFTEASPLHELSDRYLLSAHMVQHLLLSYVVAPLLLVGCPAWVVRPFYRNRVTGTALETMTRPLVAFFVFSLALSIWHLPFVYEAALGNDFIHHSQHLIFLALALIMWWPLLSPLPELPPLGYGQQLLYLLALPVGQFFVAAILTFAPESFYPTYQEAPRITALSPAADQQLSGVIMKILSFIVFGVPLVVVFFRWAASEGSHWGRRSAR